MSKNKNGLDVEKVVGQIKELVQKGNVSKIIRPLAKLSRAIKVANTSNKREAESKAFSAIAVAL